MDLHDQLLGYFIAEGVPAPTLPPKIDNRNCVQRNQALTARKIELEDYLWRVLDSLSDRMPIDLLQFLGVTKSHFNLKTLSDINLSKSGHP